jgi:hypothetical protein
MKHHEFVNLGNDHDPEFYFLGAMIVRLRELSCLFHRPAKSEKMSQWFYWVLFLVPVASYSACAVIAYVTLPPSRFLLMPSSVVLVAPSPYIHGFSSAAVLVLLLLVAYRSYRFLSRPRKGSQRLAAAPFLTYVCPALAVAGGFLYAWMALLTVSQSLVGHFVVHIGAFGVLVLYFVAMNVALSNPKQPLPTWLAAYDTAAGTAVIAYAALMVPVHLNWFQSAVYIMGVVGFVVIALVAGRFPILGWQIMGQNFVVPFATKRKKG